MLALVTHPFRRVGSRRVLVGLLEFSLLGGILTALAAAVLRIH